MAAAAAAACGAGSQAAHAQGCLVADQPGVVIEGVIDTMRGGLGKALILRASPAVCMTGVKSADQVGDTEAIHVYATSDAVMDQLFGLIRTPVRLTGRIFSPFSSYHKSKIVMEVSTVEAK